MINGIVTAFEVGTALADDLVLKFAERDMSPEEREELVQYAADIANRLIRKVAGEPVVEPFGDSRVTVTETET